MRHANSESGTIDVSDHDRTLSDRGLSACVRVGALLCLEHDAGERWFFLGPDGAGVKLRHEGQEILVISPRSPLGQALLGRQEGDEVELRVNGRLQRYEVLEVR